MMSGTRDGEGLMRLEECVRRGQSFWLWGRKGCGKSYRLGQAVEGRSAVVVELTEGMSGEAWAEALNEALSDEGVAWGEESEEFWRRWCGAVSSETLVVIDGWEAMPEALRARGVAMALEEGAGLSVVARASAKEMLGAEGLEEFEELEKLEEIKCPEMSTEEERALVRDELAWRGRPELEGAYWELVGERGTGHPLQTLTMLAGMAGSAVGRGEAWEKLERVWGRYRVRYGEAKPGFAEAEAVQEVLDAASRAAESGVEGEEDRGLLKEVFEGIDGQFRLILTRPRVGAALSALERIPGRIRGSMPMLRFRQGQCLMTVGRPEEGERSFRGLLRMKNSQAGKLAFIWTQLFEGHMGRADEALEALMRFVEERVEPGEELDAVARLMLGRLLVGRGAFEKARGIVQEGVRSALASGAEWELQLLRSQHGMCLVFTGERESGLRLMHDACEEVEKLGLELAEMEMRHLLATVYFELEEYRPARQEMERARELYGRHGARLNLRMLDVKEQIIAIILGEEELPQGGLEKTPEGWEWPYYQAELSFAEGLWAVRRGEPALAQRKFGRALELHLEQGTVQAVGRILGHYLPLVLAERSVEQARALLTLLNGEHLAQRDCTGLVGALIEVVWLSGEFGAWALVEAAARLPERSEVGSGESLFPGRGGHEPSAEVEAWVECWEGLLSNGERAGRAGDAGALRSLYEAWSALAAGEEKRCRRLMTGARDGALKGSVFGFVRGLLEEALVGASGLRPASVAEEILAYWQGLPSAVVVQQLQFWEGRLDEGFGESAPAGALARRLEVWLEVVQRWRVDGAMLLNETKGEVFYQGKRWILGEHTMGFEVLWALAHRQKEEAFTPVEELFEEVWQRPYAPPSSTNSVYVTVASLRQELGDEEGRLIGNQRGEGYALRVPVVFAPR